METEASHPHAVRSYKNKTYLNKSLINKMNYFTLLTAQ